MVLENGDYTIPHPLSTGRLAVALPVLTPSESDKLCVPVRLSNGALSLIEVETAQANDELGFAVILSNGALALVKEAAAEPTATGTASATATPTWLPGENSCNDCDPAIPDTLYVTLSGLGGDFAQFNGKNTVPWISDCLWSTNYPAKPFIRIRWSFDTHPGVWGVTIYGNQGTCGLLLLASPPNDAPCDPRDIYDDIDFCSPDDCTDPDSCADSSGASGILTYI